MIPARASFSVASGKSEETIAESLGSSPSPARKRLASARSCAWIASHTDLVEQLQRGLGPDPAEPRGRGVEAARAVAEPQRRAELVLQRVARPRTSPPDAASCAPPAPRVSTMNAVPRGHISHL